MATPAEQQGVTAGQLVPNHARQGASAMARDYQDSVPNETDIMTQLTLREATKDAKGAINTELKGVTMGLDKSLLYMDMAGKILYGTTGASGTVALASESGLTPDQQAHMQSLYGTNFKGQVQLSDALHQLAKQERARTLFRAPIRKMLAREADKGLGYVKESAGAWSSLKQTGVGF